MNVNSLTLASAFGLRGVNPLQKRCCFDRVRTRVVVVVVRELLFGCSSVLVNRILFSGNDFFFLNAKNYLSCVQVASCVLSFTDP